MIFEAISLSFSDEILFKVFKIQNAIFFDKLV